MEVGYSMGTRGIINRRDPEGTYELDLSHPLDHQVRLCLNPGDKKPFIHSDSYLIKADITQDNTQPRI